MNMPVQKPNAAFPLVLQCHCFSNIHLVFFQVNLLNSIHDNFEQ